MNHRGGHLTEERIQEFLDERLSAEERVAVQAHLDRCAGCRAEVEAWRSVFARLERIPELSPSSGFVDRVAAAIPETKGTPSRVAEWLRGLLPDRGGRRTRHLETELVLSYLDRALPDRHRSRVRGHLERCGACRTDVNEWRRIFRALDELERFTPSEGFADAVLSGIRPVREPTPRTESQRVGAVPEWLERLRPRSWKGWAAAGGAAAAPAVAMVAGLLALFSHPLLTPTNLGTFLWWQVTGAAGTLLGTAARSATESPLLFRTWEALETLSGIPGALGVAALAFSGSTLTALWILYRNLLSTRSPGRGHASA